MAEEESTSQPKKYAFELTRAEFLNPKIQEDKLGGKTEGLVAIEKICKSPTTWQFHYIGAMGVVEFVKRLIAEKV